MPDSPIQLEKGAGKDPTASRVVRYVGIALIFVAFTIAALVLGLRFSTKNKDVLMSNETGVTNRWGGAIT